MSTKYLAVMFLSFVFSTNFQLRFIIHLCVFPDSLVDSIMPQVEHASLEPSGNLCTLPERLRNTLLYRGSTFVEPSNRMGLSRREKLPSGDDNRYFPNGTEVLFKCLSAYGGKKTTWKIVCQDGVWVGRPHNCGKSEFQR